MDDGYSPVSMVILLAFVALLTNLDKHDMMCKVQIIQSI